MLGLKPASSEKLRSNQLTFSSSLKLSKTVSLQLFQTKKTIKLQLPTPVLLSVSWLLLILYG